MKIKLNEDLFDEINNEWIVNDNIDSVLGGPQTGIETTIANELIDNVNGEWDTITKYNNMITDLKQAGLDDFIPVIEDINNEEHKHIGQLQELLKKISPNTNSIASGETEGAEQLIESYIQEKDIKKQANDIFDYIDDFKKDIAVKYPAKLRDVKALCDNFVYNIENIVNFLDRD